MTRALLLGMIFLFFHEVAMTQAAAHWGVKLYGQHIPERVQSRSFQKNDYPIGPIVPAVSILVQQKQTYIIDFQINRLGLEESEFPDILKQRDIAFATDITYQQLARGRFTGWLGFGLEVSFSELEYNYSATFSTGFIDEESWAIAFNGVTRLQYAISDRLAIDLKSPLLSLLASRTQIYGEDSLSPAPSTSTRAAYRFRFVPNLFLGLEYRFGRRD